MAKTYDVYIAKTTYELVYPPESHRIYLHFESMSESSLEYMKAIADKGEIAIAYMANEEESVTGDYNA